MHDFLLICGLYQLKNSVDNEIICLLCFIYNIGVGPKSICGGCIYSYYLLIYRYIVSYLVVLREGWQYYIRKEFVTKLNRLYHLCSSIINYCLESSVLAIPFVRSGNGDIPGWTEQVKPEFVLALDVARGRQASI